MKKNAMLKIAAILLVAVLLTTCAISSTFAKYVSTGSGEYKTARVAKWGLNIVTTTTAPVLTEYDSTAEETHVATDTQAILLAPGAKANYVTTTTFTGDPEVAFDVATVATVTVSGWTIGEGEIYFPVEVKVGGEVVDVDTTSTTSIANSIKAAIETKGTKSYAADATLTSETLDLSVELAWAYTADGDAAAIAAADAKDKALGDAAVNTPSTIQISIAQTATQTN